MSIILSGGVGESAGDSLLTSTGVLHKAAGEVWWVDSATGDDTNHGGKDKLQPYATLSKAHTAASNGDLIILMDGHAETYTSALTISKNVIIAAAGQASSKPTVKFTNSSASTETFIITGTGVQLRNIWFEEMTGASGNSAVTIDAQAGGLRLKDCYFELNEKHNGRGVSLSTTSSDNCRISGCTFISTATDATDPPLAALWVGAALSELTIEDTVFDGGTVGFVGGDALTMAAIVTNLTMEGISLLRGAKMQYEENSTGHVLIGTATGGGGVDYMTA